MPKILAAGQSELPGFISQEISHWLRQFFQRFAGAAGPFSLSPRGDWRSTNSRRGWMKCRPV